MSRDMTDDERDEEIGILRGMVARLREERDRLRGLVDVGDKAIEALEGFEQRYGREINRMRPVVEAAERLADSWTAEGDLNEAVAAYRKARS